VLKIPLARHDANPHAV